MSLTIVLLTKNNIWAIADKRTSARDYSFVHDDAMKLRKIKDDLYLSGLCEVDIANLWIDTLRRNNHLSVAEILKLAEIGPRLKPYPADDVNLYDNCVIYGRDDAGELFLWLAHSDGTTEIIKGGDNMVCKIFSINDFNNSPDTTSNKVGAFLQKQIISTGDIDSSMIASLQFGASIDSLISPTFDKIKISPGPRRLVISTTGAQNYKYV